jgi:hypothetical protein
MTVVESVNGKTGVVALPGLTSEGELPSSVVSDSRGVAAGDLLLFNGTSFVRLPKGEDGQYITVRSDGTVGYLTPQLLDFRTVYGAKCNGAVHNFSTTEKSFNIESAAAEAGWVGRYVVGAGIPRGTTIESVAGKVVKLSHEATVTSSAVKLTVGTDDSAAYQAWWNDVVNSRATAPEDSNSPVINISPKSLAIPPGITVIAEGSELASKVNDGALIRGAGRGASYIVWAPKEANKAMFTNKESVYAIKWEDMSFFCSDSTANWMTSVGPYSGVYTFQDVEWVGTWKYGIVMTGTNQNEQFTWNGCHIGGAWKAFLYSPPTTEEGNDNFLVFKFNDCSVEYKKGNFVELASGGWVHANGGSYVHTGNGEEEQVFFKLLGKEHSAATCTLRLDGIRIQHDHARSHLLYCEWTEGQVSLRNIDESSVESGIGFPTSTEVTTILTAEAKAGATVLKVTSTEGAHPFTVGMQIQLSPGIAESQEARTVKAVLSVTELELNEATTYAHLNGATIAQAIRKYLLPIQFAATCRDLIFTADNCDLVGQFGVAYANSVSSYEHKRSFTVSRSRIHDWEYMGRSTAGGGGYVVSNGEGGNVGNKIPVKFTACLGSVGAGGWKRDVNCTVNGEVAPGTERERHTVAFRTQQGHLPNTEDGTTLEINIPGSATITAVRMGRRALAAGSEKNWKLELLDESNSGAVIAKMEGAEATEWKTAGSLIESLNLLCTSKTAQNWLLKLKATNIAKGTTESWVEVDYIA